MRGWYDPPEQDDCGCGLEDDESHDVQQCLDDQAEDAAEARAERDREDAMEDYYIGEEHFNEH